MVMLPLFTPLHAVGAAVVVAGILPERLTVTLIVLLQPPVKSVTVMV
jgi:hypothetical protein